jgi:hypothetical protein
MPSEEEVFNMRKEAYVKGLEEIQGARKAKKLNTRRSAFREFSLAYSCFILDECEGISINKIPLVKIIEFSENWYRDHRDNYDWDQE